MKIAGIRGFTLIELMIAVVVVGILAAIAYPSYTEQVKKARRADAKGVLLQLAGVMERFYTENNTYDGACLEGDSDGCTQTVFPKYVPLEGNERYYELSIARDADTSTEQYSLAATRLGSQQDDKCGTLALSNTGVRSISNQGSGVAVDDCW